MDASALLNRLLSVQRETEWIEWKANHSEPQEIGEYLSALSNSRRHARYLPFWA